MTIVEIKSRVTFRSLTNKRKDELARMVLDLLGEVDRLSAASTCIYEARPLPGSLTPVSGPAAAWCRTHGWDCPHAQLGNKGGA